MKLHLVLVFAPLLVQCGSSSSNGSSTDSGAPGDGGDDTTSSSSGGVTDGGSSSGADGAGSSGSGSGGGDGAVQTACKTATTHDHLSYTVTNPGTSDVITLSFDVDATWAQKTPMPAPWWDVMARGSTCVFVPTVELRLGGTITGAEAGADGGITLPTTPSTWSLSGKDYPQSASDAAVSLTENVDPSSGTGNFWLSKSGTINGMPVGTDCYELDFTVGFASDPQIRNPAVNMATGSFTATGVARVGSGCP
jgi:hypothetical protein